MKPIWLLVGSAVVVLVLSLALLEIVAERVHFEPLSTGSDPGDEAGDRWQDVPVTQRAGRWEIADCWKRVYRVAEAPDGGPDRADRPTNASLRERTGFWGASVFVLFGVSHAGPDRVATP